MSAYTIEARPTDAQVALQAAAAVGLTDKDQSQVYTSYEVSRIVLDRAEYFLTWLQKQKSPVVKTEK